MANLSVVKASAGSGKTFKLTYEYVRLLIGSPDRYRHILAVTFTNKATYEMKERILTALHDLASESASPFLSMLMDDLKIPEAKIRNKARLAIAKILHDYTRFSIETIDSFFQRLIRAFTREIGLNAGYRVELNTHEVLHTATERLLMRIDENEWLKKWLTRFAEEKIQDGKSWNISENIRSLGKALFNEAYKRESGHIHHLIKESGLLDKYQQELRAIISSFEATMQQWGKEATDQISAAELDINDFSYGKSGVAGFFEKIQRKDFDIRKRVEQAREAPEKWYSKSSAKQTQIHALVSNYLLDHLQKITGYIQQQGKAYYTARSILENLYTLGILDDLLQEMEAYCREEDLFLISDSTFFLNAIIAQNDAPFIYEKAGNYYNHFMIDEFQDTSELQYQNFKPLIENSLAQNHHNLLVGDVKQSIYRWRNTNWEVFEHRVKEDFQQMVNEYSLGKNWRSLPHVVTFNNLIFSILPEILQDHYNHKLDEAFVEYAGTHGWNAIIRSVYKEVYQEPTQTGDDAGANGYVEICTADLAQEALLDKLVADIKRLQDAGYRAGDIAVLVRKSKQARQVVQHLLLQSQEQTGYDFSVISGEALLIDYSSAVKLVIDTLRFLIHPEDAINTFEMLYFYHKLVHDPTQSSLKEPLTALGFTSHPLTDFMPGHVLDRIERLRHLSLLEVLEQTIELFGLYNLPGERLYLNRLLDVALTFQERQGSDIYLFLEYWQKEQDSLSVNPSGNQDAIRVLTVHKSKGLEFKAVLIPFCDWSLDHERNDVIQWVQPQEVPFNQLPLVPVRYTSTLAKTHFATGYFHEMVKIFIDNLNILYVAQTRASEALIITASQEEKSNISTIGHLLLNGCREMAAQDGGLSEQEPHVFVMGTIKNQHHREPEQAQIDGFADYYTSQPWHDKLKIAFQGKDFFHSLAVSDGKELRIHGQLMHEIFAGINSYVDIEKAVREVYFAGKIDADEKERYIRDMHDKITKDPLVKEWFQPGQKVFSEKNIYQKDGGTYRPDRVVWKDDRIEVIDYKFGEHPSTAHKAQVGQYLELIAGIEAMRVTGYIWYYHLNRVEEVELTAGSTNQLKLW